MKVTFKPKNLIFQRMKKKELYANWSNNNKNNKNNNNDNNETYPHSNSSEKPSANTDVKNSKGVKIIIKDLVIFNKKRESAEY